ncbi:MAG: L-threonine 3-dehydrogenase [Ignavibacteriae bacterium]|nr:MAG: L-threonine 3-dehydrogenase [Ignavibacteriota bacterium]
MEYMKAVVKEKPYPGKEWHKGFKLVKRGVPEVKKPDDVKIKVLATAICGTDVGIYNAKDSLKDSMMILQKDDVIVGHEFAGTIADAGTLARKHILNLLKEFYGRNTVVRKYLGKKNPQKLINDSDFIKFLEKYFYFTAEMHITCGKCVQCKAGEYHVCQNTIINGIHGDGSYAEYLVVPARNIRIFLKSDIPLEVIAFMDAIGNATHTVQSVDVKGKSVAILGCGVQGLMATAVAKYMGAKTIFVTDASHGEFTHDKLEQTRFRLARLYGAKYCYDVSIDREREMFYKKVLEETRNAGVDAVFEMSGNYKAYEDAFKVVRMGGTISLLGIPGGHMVTDFAKHIIFPGITIKGIIGRRVWETWDVMTEILKKGLAKKFVRSGFITHTLPLEQVDQGINAIMKGDALKVILKP